MVAFDSSTIHHGLDGQELAIQEWLEGVFRGWGLETRLFEPDNEKMKVFPDSSPGHSYRNRPNLVATLKGAGSGRSLILNGHVDTMPAGDRAKWTHDPWGGEIADGDMYGLGVCDMKAGVAAMILATRFLCEAGFPPQGDVMIQSVVDEEGGGNGTLGCVVEGYKADAAIVTEPTRLHVQPASRGVLLLEVDVEGRATHACLKWGGVNAIEKGVKIIQGMIELERLWLAQRRNPLYPPPTITIGQINGGLAGSQVPGECVLKFDVKYLPVEMDRDGRGKPNDADMVKADVVNWIRTLIRGRPLAGRTPADADLVSTLHPSLPRSKSSTGRADERRGAERHGLEQRLRLPRGLRRAPLAESRGVPTVIFGPGDLQYAHSIDEGVGAGVPGRHQGPGSGDPRMDVQERN